jgi:hypothetical protein
MRLQNHVILAHAAPAASVPIARFDKVNGSLVLGPPQSFHHFILGFIHLNKAARGENRVHREILMPDVAVGKFTVRKLS